MEESTSCPLCDGRGAFVAPSIVPCTRCHGHGIVTATSMSGLPARTAHGRMALDQPCPDCQGRGYQTRDHRTICLMCQGTGQVPTEDITATRVFSRYRLARSLRPR
jgi:DnaJ-class molecular chaperone